MSLYDYLNFYGSLYGCPHGARLPDCPVKPVEHEPFEKKFNWFMNLSEKEKDAIVSHHLKCSEKRDPWNK